MGLRFRRSIKIAPGVKINLGKKGISTSIGKRGAGITFGPNGTSTHVGIPGTGVSYTKKVSSSSQRNSANNKKENSCSSNCGCYLLLFALIAIVWLIILGDIVQKYGNNVGYIFMGVTFALPIIFLIIYFISFFIKDKKDAKKQKEENKFASNIDIKNKSAWTRSLDPLFIQSAYIFVKSQQCSISKLQRNFSIGMNRAGRIMTQLEQAGIVGSEEGKYSRVVLIKDLESLKRLLIKLGTKDITKSSNTSSVRSTRLNSKDNLSVNEQSCEYKINEQKTQYDGPLNEENIINGIVGENVKKANSTTNKVSKSKIIIGTTIDLTPYFNANEIEKQTNPYEELNSLIGLSSVKEEIQSLANFIRLNQKRKEQGLTTTSISYHCVFTGNPGTGKTTVARLLAGIFRDLGILDKGHLIETDRSGLVAEFVGQTAVKTNKIIDSALDGVLFIDEAYTLAQGGPQDYGHEAIATLLKRMEDDRKRLVVILAGYREEMRSFIDSNPGLRSRFNRYINFPDYSAEELLKIFESYLKKQQYTISDTTKNILFDFLKAKVAAKQKDFGNARFVRNLFERIIEQQANRLSSISSISNEQLQTITEDDVKSGILKMQ